MGANSFDNGFEWFSSCFWMFLIVFSGVLGDWLVPSHLLLFLSKPRKATLLSDKDFCKGLKPPRS